MGWSIGYDDKWGRDIGYGVPSQCDHPDCGVDIDRGLSYVCGSEPFGGEHGCGLYFCESHRSYAVVVDKPDAPGVLVLVCERCFSGQLPFPPSPDTKEWMEWKLNDEGWADWRSADPDLVEAIRLKIGGL